MTYRRQPTLGAGSPRPNLGRVSDWTHQPYGGIFWLPTPTYVFLTNQVHCGLSGYAYTQLKNLDLCDANLLMLFAYRQLD